MVRSQRIIVTFLVLISISLWGCFNPIAAPVYIKGVVSFSVDTFSGSKTLQPILPAISKYEFTFTNGTDSIGPLTQIGASGSFELIGGDWNCTIKGKDENNMTIVQADTSFRITAGQTTPVDITLKLIRVGNGTARVTVTWPKNQVVNEVYAELNGTAIDAADLNISASAVRYDKSLAVGSYRFSVRLSRDGVLLAYVQDAIQVFGNLTTSGTIALMEQDFTAPPAAPANLSIVSSDNNLTLAWSDSSNVETSFVVERSTDNSIFEVIKSDLAPNSSSYVDSNVSAGIIYYYRVKALNPFGSSPPTNVELSDLYPALYGLSGDTSPRKVKNWSWSSNDDNATYQYIINTNGATPADWSGLNWVSLSEASQAGGDGTYYIHVRAKSQTGKISSVQTVSAFLDNTAPAIPGFNTSAQTTIDKTPRWDWKTVSGASKYKYGIMVNDTASTPSNWTSTTATDFTSGTVGAGTYTLHVKAVDLAGNESGSKKVTITVTNSVSLNNPEPVNNKSYFTNRDNTDILGWQGVNGAVSYEVGLYKNGSTTIFIKTSSNTILNLGTSLNQGSYSWRIRAKDDSGNFTNWSGYKYFEVNHIKKIVSGENHTVALRENGELYVWGKNQFGQLGDGTTNNRTTPKKLDTALSFIDVAVGQYHTIAISTDKKVYTWGYNMKGQLGRSTNALVPKIPSGLSTSSFKSVEAGDNFSVALTTGGNVIAWGDNQYGQLCGGFFSSSRQTPEVINSSYFNYNPVTQIAVGSNHVYVINSENQIFCWGKNKEEQLAQDGGGSTSYNTAVKPAPFSFGTELGAGYNFALVIKQGTSNLYGAGDNSYGQLSRNPGSVVKQTSFQQLDPSRLSAPIDTFSAGKYHVLILDVNGNVYSLGSNGYKQLGRNVGSYAYIADKVYGFEAVKYVSACDYRSFAIQTDGQVYGWGYNGNSKLLIGTGPTGGNLSSPTRIGFFD